MTAYAPVEIWEKILKYTISVPLFFDCDPISNYGIKRLSEYRFEADYWESERVRNSLRRVCKSWDIFLRLYDHRYVRLLDVYQHRVPKSAISAAIRLNLYPNPYYIEPSSILHQVPHADRIQNKNDFLWKIINDPSNMPTTSSGWMLEIVDGYLGYSNAIFVLLLENAPRLEAFIELSTNLTVLPSAAEQLKAIYMEQGWTNRLMPCTWSVSYLPCLTTLRLRPLGLEVPLHKWQLPALRHLSIKPQARISSTNEAATYFLQILEAFGDQLITFYYNIACIDFEVPHEFWSYIPHVRRLQLPFWRDPGPPAGHPIDFIRVPAYYLFDTKRHSSTWPSFPYWECQLPENPHQKRRLTVQLD